MYWHAEITSLLLRGYVEPGGYADKRPFQAVIGAKFIGPHTAFLEGALRVDGQELQRADWRDLAVLLRTQHSIEKVFAKRGTALVEFDTLRWGAVRPK